MVENETAILKHEEQINAMERSHVVNRESFPSVSLKLSDDSGLWPMLNRWKLISLSVTCLV